jgi:hypothetical protein
MVLTIPQHVEHTHKMHALDIIDALPGSSSLSSHSSFITVRFPLRFRITAFLVVDRPTPLHLLCTVRVFVLVVMKTSVLVASLLASLVAAVPVDTVRRAGDCKNVLINVCIFVLFSFAI